MVVNVSSLSVNEPEGATDKDTTVSAFREIKVFTRFCCVDESFTPPPHLNMKYPNVEKIKLGGWASSQIVLFFNT